jgi:hypothetical protein
MPSELLGGLGSVGRSRKVRRRALDLGARLCGFDPFPGLAREKVRGAFGHANA